MAAREKYTHGHHESVLRSHTWRTIANSAAYLAPHLRRRSAGARRRLWPRHDHRRDRRPRRAETDRCLPSTRRRTSSRWRPRRKGVRTSRSASATRMRSKPRTTASTSCTPTRCCSTSPIRSPRCVEMRRVCRPGGLVAARDCRLHRHGLVPARPRAVPSGSSCTASSRGATVATRTPDADCSPTPTRPASTRSPRQPASGASRLLPIASGGPTSGPTASSSRPSPSRRSAAAHAKPEDLERIADAWRTWASDPDAWFAVLHGEILARA